MNRVLLFRRSLIVAASLAAVLAGCELVVDFDRSKIDAGSFDASIADVNADQTVPPGDASGDGSTDGQTDGAPDGDTDAAVDAASDGGTDSATDSAPDAPDDAPDDADDAG